MGLDKLKSTKEIVSTLQAELEANQPVLEPRPRRWVSSRSRSQGQGGGAGRQGGGREGLRRRQRHRRAGVGHQGAGGRRTGRGLPALDAAVKCLAKLDKSQIVEVKALKKPPAGVKLTLKAVCIMFQIKPAKIADPDNPTKKIDDYFGPASKMLNDLGPDKFKQQLIDFDKDNIPEAVIKLIDPVCALEEFTPEAIVKVSVACEAICLWCHAMRKYYYVALEVELLRNKFAAAEIELADATASKEAAEAKLDAVTKKVAALEAALQAAVEKMASLEAQVERATIQLSTPTSSSPPRRQGCRGGDHGRADEQPGLVGDVLICAGTISTRDPLWPTTGRSSSRAGSSRCARACRARRVHARQDPR